MVISKKRAKPYILFSALSLLSGGASVLIAYLISGKSMKEYYSSLNTPSWAPPSWVFPVVWTVLFILMGIGAGKVYLSKNENRKTALTVFAVQLILNFGWSIVFFGFGALSFAFLWAVALTIAVGVMSVMFYKIEKTAGVIQLPYLLWCVFATALTLAVSLKN